MRRFWFWPLALLALPNCGLYQGGIPSPTNLIPGPTPNSDVIFCDIEADRHCPNNQAERDQGIRVIGGAVALVEGRSNKIGLDYSLNAINQCNGDPQVVEYLDDFPVGTRVCLNCGAAIPSNHANAQAVCVARCSDLALSLNLSDCANKARPSTNIAVAPPPFCFANACSATGTPLDPNAFVDPRRKTEPATWATAIDVKASGQDNNTLTRNMGGGTTFDAGASSNETIDRRDAYIQFEATETTGMVRLAGLKQGGPSNTPGVANINFAIDLFWDGCFYIFESGTPIVPTKPEPSAPGCKLANAVGSYTTGDKFRIVVEGELDGTSTAKITYEHIPQSYPCDPDNGQRLCDVMWKQTSMTTAQYPLRFDSAFRELNASIANVRLVRDRQ